MMMMMMMMMMEKRERRSNFEERLDDGSQSRSNNPHNQQSPRQTTAILVPMNTTRTDQIIPTHESFQIMFNHNISNKPSFAEKLWKILFFVHLLATATIIIFLTIRGFKSMDRSFNPRQWYLPLIASTGFSIVAAISWLLLTIHYPTGVIKASLWLAPLLTLAISILLFNTETAAGLAFALIALFSAIFQALYSCWVASRLEHAEEILADSLSAAGTAVGITKFMAIAIVHCFLFSGFWILGIGGTAAHGTGYNALFIVILLLSLAWTMQVIRNTVHVAISRIAYLHFAHGVPKADAADAFKMTYKHLMGSICLGSVFVPTIGVFRGMARTLKLMAGNHDEFMFSCADCYMGFADWLMTCGNRWGYVHVGVHQKGFVRASGDVWEAFVRARMTVLIDTDLISSFCFLSGVAGGMMSALVGGIWVTVINKRYTAAISVYSILIGYFTIRVAMALPQACVSAYHVAYSENQQNPRLASIIPRRIRELLH